MPRQEMEVYSCCRQALRTTDATAQRDYRHTTIQLWCATISQRSSFKQLFRTESFFCGRENLCGIVWAKQCLNFRLKVKKWLSAFLFLKIRKSRSIERRKTEREKKGLPLCPKTLKTSESIKRTL